MRKPIFKSFKELNISFYFITKYFLNKLFFYFFFNYRAKYIGFVDYTFSLLFNNVSTLFFLLKINSGNTSACNHVTIRL